MEGTPVYFREMTNGDRNPNESISWNKAEDRVSITSFCGLNFTSTGKSTSPFLRIGTRKKVSENDYADATAFDLATSPRTGLQPLSPLTMYVTGDITDRTKSIQFRQSDATQGIGFTMNAIYTAGSMDNQDLNLEVTGTGKLIFKTKDAPRMVINNEGFVGIGTLDPAMPLHVTKKLGRGNIDYAYEQEDRNSLDLGWGKYVESTNDEHRKFNNCSILADGDIVTKNVLVSTRTSQYSDIRLKKDIKLSSSKQDLEKLNQVQVVNYKMIDTIADNKQYKKVIAQQIQKVYPQATDYSFKTLPDVFQLATSVSKQNDSVYLVSVAKPENLKAGDQIELKCQPAQDVNVQVEQVISANTFLVKSKTDLSGQKSVFVYGRPATDVLTVDYDALSMLNISATQQLAKTVDEQQKLIDQLKKQNTDIAAENEKLKTEQASTKETVNIILARLSQIEDKTKPVQQVVASVKE
jgi:hypothetical protein